jgi:hypothetical protein
LKPVVGFPVAETFNKVAYMDLKEITKGKLWFLHMIDGATKYTVASLIDTKKKEVVVDRIFEGWIAYFGAPRKLHSDCGGEFCNEVLREMNEKLGRETSTTPGEAPFSNGVVERNNKIIYESMMKTMEDAKVDMSTALAWAVSAKNALQNVSGYSPNQLVFGMNVNLLSVLTDRPPALESATSDIIRKKLAALHSAQQNFIKAESSERIRKALRHQVRTFSEELYETGDKVYFKRKNTKGWKGPAKVLGKEGNFVLIRLGNSFYRCHPCHLMKVDYENSLNKKGGVDPSTETSSAVHIDKLDKPQVKACDSQDDSDVSDDEVVDPMIHQQSSNDIVANVEDIPAACEASDDQDTTVSPLVDNEVDENNGSPLVDNRDHTVRPTQKTTIEFLLQNGERHQTKLFQKSKQPRATSKYKNWLNVRRIDMEEDSSVN